MFRRTILSINEFFEHSLFEEKNVYKEGLMQKVSPEEKLVLTFVVVVTTLVEKNALSIGLFFGLSVSLSLLSKVDFFEFLKRTFIFIPLYSLIISFPRLFIDNKSPEITIRFLGVELGTSFSSIDHFLAFNMRVIIATSMIVLVAMTTTIGELSSVLRKIMVPKEVLVSFLLTYRLLFVYLTKIKDLILSIESRTVENKIGIRETGKLMANLLLRGFEESELVFLALKSRNFEDINTLHREERRNNLTFAFLVILFLLLSIRCELLA